jgi:knotted carbamoyltransferase YgeW
MNKEKISKLCDENNNLETNLFNKDFLITWNHSEDEIKAVALVAEILKEFHKNKISPKIFNSGLAISIFRDHSTRTRFSFASAVNLLGLGLAELDEVKSQVAHGETVFETANMISFLAETIGIRDDMYLGEGNKYMEEVSDAVQYGYDNGVLHQRPSIINLQSDIDHPTQTMADLLKLKNYFGGFENLKGKKIAMTWAYSPSYGKPLSVPQGVIGLMSRFGMNVSLAYPEGYELIPEVIEKAEVNSIESGGNFEIVNSMEEAFKNADVVYPKSWAPYQVMSQRTELLKAKDQQGLKDLEKECLNNNAKYKNWHCDEERMKLTINSEALYQHCLPADITGVSCAEGEVSKGVFDKYKIHTYQQAGFKPFVIAAMIFLTRIRKPGNKLIELLRNGIKTQF